MWEISDFGSSLVVLQSNICILIFPATARGEGCSAYTLKKLFESGETRNQTVLHLPHAIERQFALSRIYECVYST
jgi:hypothetical protein